LSEKLKIGITCGDLNGIGPETIIRVLEDLRMQDHANIFIYANNKALMFYRKKLNAQHFNFHTTDTIDKSNLKMINCIQCWEDTITIMPGTATPQLGKYAFRSLERASVDLAQGKLHAIITAPINKQTIHSEYFPFKGHTEYFAERFHAEPLMLLVHHDLRVATVTTHIPVGDVAKNMSAELIQKKIEILYNTLQSDFGIIRPRIAVLGLNPHAGDDGLIGHEEKTIIIPAIFIYKNQKKLVYGPFPADGFFAKQSYTKFDAILAMYHDQGLIPFKTIAQQNGVNYTAGLPVIRTSPDHGTAYDIAGKGIAKLDSMRNAIFTAIDIYRQRKYHKEIHAHPLKREQVVIGGEDEIVTE